MHRPERNGALRPAADRSLDALRAHERGSVTLPHAGPGAATTHGVAVLRWPADADTRRRLAELRIPRLLLVGRGDEPPVITDELEDWAREPLDPTDLSLRSETLRRRARDLPVAPILDSDGLLRFGGRWAVVPDSQLAVVELLIRRYGEVVGFDELADAYARAGGARTPGSVRAVIARLRTRVADVGLRLHGVRGRGVLLAQQTPTTNGPAMAPRAPG